MGALGSCHQHLHTLASLGACGFLAVRNLPPQLNKEERMVRELSQLLDVHDLYNKGKEFKDSSNTLGHSSGDCIKHIKIPTIAERFMGMKAAMVTNSDTANAFGKTLGFSVTALHELCNETGIPEELKAPPAPLSAASKLLNMLGLRENTVEENSEFDLVFLHMGPNLNESEVESGYNNAPLASTLEWINALAGKIMEIIHPSSAAASRLYLALVLSYGSNSSEKSDDSSLLISSEEISPSLASLLPYQSYTMKGGKLLNDVRANMAKHNRHHHPMLAVQHQEGVTRRDGAKIFSFEEFQEQGGNRAILADRFLYEIAFKLWKTPKYGA